MFTVNSPGLVLMPAVDRAVNSEQTFWFGVFFPEKKILPIYAILVENRSEVLNDFSTMYPRAVIHQITFPTCWFLITICMHNCFQCSKKWVL